MIGDGQMMFFNSELKVKVTNFHQNNDFFKRDPSQTTSAGKQNKSINFTEFHKNNCFVNFDGFKKYQCLHLD